MEVLELVAAFDAFATSEDVECKEEAASEDPGWSARINGLGTDGTKCSGTELYKFMKAHEKSDPVGFLPPPHPFVRKPGVTGYKWDLATCTPTHFPLQAHHLIPKNHLPKHGVCAFLAAKYSENPDYKLAADTAYNTDHGFNGYCMPYATPLAEWKTARTNAEKKLDLCRQLMEKVHRQLHQGSHKAAAYDDPADAHEEDVIHSPDKFGYLDMVDRLLSVVQDAGQSHSDSCGICEKKKTELPPREAPVKQVDQVSGIVKLLIDANRIFVSEAAFRCLKSDRPELDRPDWMTNDT